MPQIIHDAIPESGVISVSTLQVLLPFTDFSKYAFDGLLFWVKNADATNVPTINFETSEDGVYVDSTYTYQYTPVVGTGCSVPIGEGSARKFFCITASGPGPSYPLTRVQWGVRGVRRLP